MVESYFSYYTS